MSAFHLVAGTCCTAAVMLGTTIAGAQNYPTKPIRVYTSEVGGGPDFTIRLLAPELSNRLGQQIVVDSRVAQLSIENTAKAPPDGYTLVLIGAPLWVLPLLRAKLPFDTLRDFIPISLAVNSPSVVVVHPSVPVKSVKELIALAQARPGDISFASGSTGSATFLAGELFKSMAHVNIVGIPYKSSGPALIDLLGGHVQLAFANAGPASGYVKAGRLRALAVTSLQPSALAPGLPTVASSGLPGYEAGSKQGLFAPAGTPAAIVTRLNHEMVEILNLPEIKQRFFNSGVETVGSTPEEFAAKIKSEMARLGKMIREIGIKPD